MNKLWDIKEIKNLIKTNPMTVVYFTGRDCGACDVIKIKIQEILKNYPEIRSCQVDGEKALETAAYFSVFSLPLFLLYIQGKESLRIGRNVNLIELNSNIKRYYEMIYQ